ncbi:MAG: acyloxyacyl hydrolase [Rhizobiaceae bacterium]
MKTLVRLAITALCMSSFSYTAQAQESFINEARFGGHWAQPGFLEVGHKEKNQTALSAELLFQPINIDFLDLFEGSQDSWAYSFVTPRPHLGVTANLAGNGTSYAYGGLTWHFDVTNTVFLEGGLGMAYTNGSKSGSPTRAALGAHWQFHESLAVGFNITENVTLVTQYEHLSHRKVFSDNNRGLGNLSVKVGLKF